LIEKNQKLVKLNADSAPCNFAHRWVLVEAEIGRIKNEPIFEVLEKYNHAVK
jgi:hypothetical protein